MGDITAVEQVQQVWSAVVELASKSNVPFFFGMPVGHFGPKSGVRNQPVPFGNATLEWSNGALALDYDIQATLDTLKQRRQRYFSQ